MITYGNTCPLAEKGHNAENWRQQQLNLSLLVSKYDNQPLTHMVHPGNHTSMTTMQHVIPRLSDFSIQNGTIIWDRGNTSNKTVNALENMGWKIICGVPKVSDEAKEIIISTEIPENPDFLVPCKNTGELYACKIQAKLFGQMRETVVYRNVTKATKSLIRRNKAIYVISQELTHLKSELHFNSQQNLKLAVKGILNGWKRFFIIEYPEDEKIVDFSWSVNEKKIAEAKSMDGKFLLYSSDTTYSAMEVVKMYLEKDFIEKAFRTIKTDEDLKPIRHRLESRVKAIIFVCTLAYRLLSALRWMINSSKSKDVTLSESLFIKKLARIEKLEVNLGKEIEVFYVKVTTDLKKQVAALGMADLFAGRRFLVE
jgi:transposase